MTARLAEIRKLYNALPVDERRSFIRWLRANHGFEKAAWLMGAIESEAGR